MVRESSAALLYTENLRAIYALRPWEHLGVVKRKKLDLPSDAITARVCQTSTATPVRPSSDAV